MTAFRKWYAQWWPTTVRAVLGSQAAERIEKERAAQIS